MLSNLEQRPYHGETVLYRASTYDCGPCLLKPKCGTVDLPKVPMPTCQTPNCAPLAVTVPLDNCQLTQSARAINLSQAQRSAAR